MSEIKFKALDLVTDTMYYPGEDGTQIVLGMNQAYNDDSRYKALWTDEGEIASGEDLLLLQYSGLQDENQNEICESDVIVNSRGTKLVVEFLDGCFMARGRDSISDSLVFDYLLHFNSWSRIIGNIHDNPELLENQHA